MAISVNWPTKVINIPKADTILVTLVPFEIRQIDLNDFRLALKDLEDNVQGINWLKTHNHTAPFSVGGTELARVINIVNEYTVTFEDGSYAVNLVGGNTNLADRLNLNSVQVRPNNSAGLATSSAIEFGEYGGGVTVDTGNLTGNAAAGSAYYTGTLRRPCLNISDAIIIMEARGFQKMYIIGSATFTSAHGIDGKIVIGTSHVQNTVTLEPGASCVNCVFRELKVVGTLDGTNEISNCIVTDLTYFSGHVHDSGLIGSVTLAGGTPSVFSDCKTIDPFSVPEINVGGSGQDLAMPNYSGLLRITNLDSLTNLVGIGLLGGTVVLDSATVLQGTIHVSGTGMLEDENGQHIPSGTWNGGVTIITDTLMNMENLTRMVWDTIVVDVAGGEAGTDFPIGTAGRPSNNLVDTKAIAEREGVYRIRVHGNQTLTGNWAGYVFVSETHEMCTLTLSDAILDRAKFTSLGLQGSVAGGEITCENVVFPGAVTGLSADLENCQFRASITIADDGYVKGDRCTSEFGATITFGTNATLAMANFSGVLNLADCVSAGSTIGVTGQMLLTLESSCTSSAPVLLSGVGILVDLSSLSNVTNRIVDASQIYASYKIAHNRNKIDIDNSQLIIYEANGVDEYMRFDLKDEAGAPATTDVFEREPV